MAVVPRIPQGIWGEDDDDDPSFFSRVRKSQKELENGPRGSFNPRVRCPSFPKLKYGIKTFPEFETDDYRSELRKSFGGLEKIPVVRKKRKENREAEEEESNCLYLISKIISMRKKGKKLNCATIFYLFFFLSIYPPLIFLFLFSPSVFSSLSLE